MNNKNQEAFRLIFGDDVLVCAREDSFKEVFWSAKKGSLCIKFDHWTWSIKISKSLGLG